MTLSRNIFYNTINILNITAKKAKIATFELSKEPIKKGRNELLDSLRPVLRRVGDAIRTFL
ncbi:MAG: hypothetical protein ACD_12C00450G0002 [uncultured bacterium]|nr:MAG: hypothetical protein ACD_12C00450G0002 [uncultured bacterium]